MRAAVRIAVTALFAALALTAAAGPRAGDPLRRLTDDPRATREPAKGEGEPAAGLSGGGFGIEVATGTALPDAAGWLAANQNVSGSWGSAYEFADTAAVVESLGGAEPRGFAFNRGAGWLTGQTAFDNDSLSRQILALGRVPGFDLKQLSDRIVAARAPASTNPSAPNYPEGGWGLAAGYETDNLTTALALMALDTGGLKGGIAVVSQPVAGGTTDTQSWTIPADATKVRLFVTVTGSTVRLRMTQGAPPTPAAPYFALAPGGPYQIVFPDSGLPFTPGTNYISVESPSPPATAASYTMTASYETPTFDTRSIAEAIAYLRQARNGDGGWGIQRGDATSVYTTLHVLLALQRYRQYDFDVELPAGISWLLARQLGDGSFGSGGPGVPYITALAALNLIRYQLCPFSAATNNAVSALLAMRSAGGSWVMEPYDTGLAYQALWEYDGDGDGIFKDGDCSGTAGDHLCTAGQSTGCDDNCAAYANGGQLPVVFPQTIEMPSRNRIAWPQPADVVFVKGSLAGVSSYNIIAFGTAPYATFLDVAADTPAPQAGFYYLVRPGGDCTVPSWQTVLGAEPGRDTALRGSIDVVITSPANAAVILSSPVTVSGTQNGTAPVTVTVNGVAATVTGGTFSASVPLVRGANTITASGTDAAGRTGSQQIGVTLVDYSIARGGLVTGFRIFTAASTVLDQAAFYTESQSGVPSGVTYTTTGVSRISATQMRVDFRINVSAGAPLGLYFFQVTYGLLNSSSQPIGPLSGNVFDFEIQVKP